MRLLAAFVCLLFFGLQDVMASEPVDYVRQIKPLLAARCFSCHGALKQESGLRVDTAAAMRTGGDSGPAAVPGKSGESLMVARCADLDPATRMPPENEASPLDAEQLALLRAWIDQGAAGPADEQPEPDPREHWAFRAPVRPEPPAVANSAWVINPIDAFIAAEHQRRQLVPQPALEKRLLLRRVYFDLIGLPPTVEEQEAFLADASPDAYERVVDRLLARPEYGQRWGRHWMDIWRYSDWWGLGAEVRNSQKHIWHWRDWIVESLNDDVGYDEMLRQMLAADELYPNDLDKLRATGYLVRNYFKFNRNTWMEGTIEHTSKAFLGLTFNCARCHDHKFDPLSQADYYRLRAFFEPHQIRTDQAPGEVDYEKGGIPRVFDCNLSAPTYLFARGDEKQPVKDKPLSPGLPALLAFEELKIEPITLPVEAHQPGLRPWILDNYLAAAEKQIATARESLDKARQTLATAEKASAAEQASTTEGEATAGEKDVNDAKKGPSIEEARAAVAVAEKTWAAALAEPPSLRARSAADQAQHEQPPAENIQELIGKAALAQRQAEQAKAAEALAKAELELLKAAEAKKAESEKKVAAARQALEKATQAVAAPGEAYTPLSGALKTLESNVETAESRNRPFPETSTGRRTALARWLTDRRNPLAARVAVNHLWARHMGQPLVATVFDFGRKGARPTHPELLDWLAVELMERQWSMKHVHRLIVTSNTYRMTSSAAGAQANQARDADNQFLWRMNATRMEAQLVRDALLHLTGRLDLSLGGPSIEAAAQEASHRRSLYFVHSHNDHHRFLSMFDDANVQECYRREQSIVPQQALALSNSRLTLETAEKIASQLQTDPRYSSDEEFIRAAFATVLGSLPSAEESLACQHALAAWSQLPTTGDQAALRARSNLVHALLNHNDFVTVR